MGVHLGKETEVAPAVEEHLPYNLGENTLGCTGYTGVVKQVAGLVFGLGEEVFGKPFYGRYLSQPLCGLQELDPVQDSSVLVLPASSCSQELFEDEGAVPDLALVPGQAAEVRQRSKDSGCEDRARAQTGPGRYRRQKSDLYAASERLELVFQRLEAFCGEFRDESCQCQCGFRNGERGANLPVVLQFLPGAYRFHGSQVDGPHRYPELRGRFHIYLQRRLPVQLDGKVHY